MRVLLGIVGGQITPEKDEDGEALTSITLQSCLLGIQYLSRKFLYLHRYAQVHHAQSTKPILELLPKAIYLNHDFFFLQVDFFF